MRGCQGPNLQTSEVRSLSLCLALGLCPPRVIGWGLGRIIKLDHGAESVLVYYKGRQHPNRHLGLREGGMEQVTLELGAEGQTGVTLSGKWGTGQRQRGLWGRLVVSSMVAGGAQLATRGAGPSPLSFPCQMGWGQLLSFPPLARGWRGGAQEGR